MAPPHLSNNVEPSPFAPARIAAMGIGTYSLEKSRLTMSGRSVSWIAHFLLPQLVHQEETLSKVRASSAPTGSDFKEGRKG